MPTIWRQEGYRVYFYANEDREPPHVHVQYGSYTAKFWLGPVVLAVNNGMNASELRKGGAIIRDHEKMLRKKWDAFFSKKK